MKNIKIAILTLLAMPLALASCDVMNTSPKETYEESAVWGSSASAYSYVYDVYRSVIQDQWVMWNVANWEIRSGNMAASGEQWYNDNYWFGQEDFDEKNNFGFFGDYGRARKINLICELAEKYRGKTLNDREANELVAQGRLLRAMFYFRQARALGRVVWIDKVLTPKDTMNNALTDYVLTPSVEVTYDKIIAEIEAATPNLPKGAAIKQGQLNTYAAQALLSQVCLQAAAYQTDLTKRAALLKKVIAAAEVVESNYSLVSDYGGLFNERNQSNNQEIIFAIYRNQVNTDFTETDMIRMIANIKNDNMKDPRTPRFVVDNKFEGWGRIYPTQNLVDNYLVVDQKDGLAKKWNETSQFTEAVALDATPTQSQEWVPSMWKGGTPLMSGKSKNGESISDLMYKNRDARFEESIIHDNCMVYGEHITTRNYGNWNAVSSDRSATIFGHHTSITNYYSRKQLYNNVENGVLLGGNKSAYHWVIFRLGRVLLDKAEAQLWLAGMGDTYSFADAVATFNRTRTTHGKLPASLASNSSDAWRDYKIERRVELYYENDLYWSSLRWGKHGGDANNGLAAGDEVQVLLEKPSSVQLSEDCTEFTINTVWRGNVDHPKFSKDKRYLLPIPKNELIKNPKLGKQNPGWPE
ncbi:MAG: RagB/SusD family nutrient uptake outer membrane protein [Mucinivorans sp.]